MLGQIANPCRLLALKSALASLPHQRLRSNHHDDNNNNNPAKMVCAKCQKLAKSTTLATPGVKKKSEMYYGSPAGSGKSGDKSKTSSTLGNNGIGKASCHLIHTCNLQLTIQRVNYYPSLHETHMHRTRAPAPAAKQRWTKEGRIARGVLTRLTVGPSAFSSVKLYLTSCLACAMCGKANSKSTAAAPVIAGQKFTLK